MEDLPSEINQPNSPVKCGGRIDFCTTMKIKWWTLLKALSYRLYHSCHCTYKRFASEHAHITVTAAHISVPVPLSFLKWRMGQRSRKSFVLFIFEEDMNVKLRELPISQCASPPQLARLVLCFLPVSQSFPVACGPHSHVKRFPGTSQVSWQVPPLRQGLFSQQPFWQSTTGTLGWKRKRQIHKILRKNEQE